MQHRTLRSGADARNAAACTGGMGHLEKAAQGARFHGHAMGCDQHKRNAVWMARDNVPQAGVARAVDRPQSCWCESPAQADPASGVGIEAPDTVPPQRKPQYRGRLCADCRRSTSVPRPPPHTHDWYIAMKDSPRGPPTCRDGGLPHHIAAPHCCPQPCRGLG